MATTYSPQSLQTATNNSTILLARDARSYIYWPSLAIRSNMPTVQQKYRQTSIVLKQATTELINGATVQGDNAVADLSIKLPKGMTDTDIATFVDSFYAVLNVAALKAALKSQDRITAAIVTA